MRRETEANPSSNTVCLRGRVSAPPEERELPSGQCIVTLRIVMPREGSPMCAGSRQPSDWVHCVAWGARPRRSAARWRVGDTVEVDGALRRRFFRTATGAVSRLEVEVLRGRLLERAR